MSEDIISSTITIKRPRFTRTEPRVKVEYPKPGTAQLQTEREAKLERGFPLRQAIYNRYQDGFLSHIQQYNLEILGLDSKYLSDNCFLSLLLITHMDGAALAMLKLYEEKIDVHVIDRYGNTALDYAVDETTEFSKPLGEKTIDDEVKRLILYMIKLANERKAEKRIRLFDDLLYGPEDTKRVVDSFSTERTEVLQVLFRMWFDYGKRWTTQKDINPTIYRKLVEKNYKWLDIVQLNKLPLMSYSTYDKEEPIEVITNTKDVLELSRQIGNMKAAESAANALRKTNLLSNFTDRDTLYQFLVCKELIFFLSMLPVTTELNTNDIFWQLLIWHKFSGTTDIILQLNQSARLILASISDESKFIVALGDEDTRTDLMRKYMNYYPEISTSSLSRTRARQLQKKLDSFVDLAVTLSLSMAVRFENSEEDDAYWKTLGEKPLFRYRVITTTFTDSLEENPNIPVYADLVKELGDELDIDELANSAMDLGWKLISDARALDQFQPAINTTKRGKVVLGFQPYQEDAAAELIPILIKLLTEITEKTLRDIRELAVLYAYPKVDPELLLSTLEGYRAKIPDVKLNREKRIAAFKAAQKIQRKEETKGLLLATKKGGSVASFFPRMFMTMFGNSYGKINSTVRNKDRWYWKDRFTKPEK